MSLTETHGLSMAATTLGASGAVVRRDGEAPTQIGRYTILKAIGAGGMGVVYAAYDNDLDRKVAIKLLHEGIGTATPDTIGHSRLLREAQAMAKISHPNVLQVFEAGTHAGQVYLALEFVEGSTLEAWLTAAPRKWQEVVALFLQCGRGLQAAHEAGLIHRDFKPENVLVDRSGRARVMDFGLARATGAMGPVPQDIPISSTHSSLRIDLTATGAVMGTPLYMAPEQHLGAVTDARTDEFAFCVALYEALYGQRPFEGDDLRVLAANVLRGLVREPPRDRGVPKWLRRAVLRGLATAPEDRFPGMPPLLAEIGRDPGAARRRALFAAAAVSLVLAGGWGVAAVQSAKDQRCRGAATQLVGTWDSTRADELARAFAATDRSYAATTAERVRGQLDVRAAAWAGLHQSACEAHARGEASAELYDAEVACLERRRSETAALVDLFARADGEVVDRAMGAVMALPRIASCSDRDALLARVKPPEDPALAEEVLRIRGELDRAKAAQDAGKYKDGIALATVAVAAADAGGHRPIIAEARLRLGELHSRANEFTQAEPALWGGLWAAEASRHDEVAAAAWTELTRVVVKQGQRADAKRWAERAGAAVARLDGDTIAEARLDNELGTIAFTGEEPAEAVARYERALALRRAALGPTHPDVVSTMSNLGNALHSLEREDEALKIHLEALAIREATLGPEHPDVAASLNNVGVIYIQAERYDEAIAVLNRARAIWVRALGPSNPTTLNGILNLGSIYYKRGELGAASSVFEQGLALAQRELPPEHPLRVKASQNAGAAFLGLGQVARGEALLREALEIQERSYGPDNINVARGLGNLGAVAALRGDADEGLALSERAVAIFERKSGPESSELLSVLGNLADLEARRGRLDRAEALARRCLAISTKVHGADALEGSNCHFGLALVAFMRHRPTEAIAELDELERLSIKSPLEPSALADCRFLRAQAIVEVGGDRDAARTLARQARAVFGAYGIKHRTAEVETWLARNKL